jgi:hypothetical protein
MLARLYERVTLHWAAGADSVDEGQDCDLDKYAGSMGQVKLEYKAQAAFIMPRIHRNPGQMADGISITAISITANRISHPMLQILLPP